MNATAGTTEAPAVPATFKAASPLAGDELAALIAAHDAQMLEGDFGTDLHGWAARVYGRITLVFPKGQDPAVRLNVAQGFIARLMALETGPCENAWCQETEPHEWCYGDTVELPSGGLHAHLTHDRRKGTTSIVYGLTDNDDNTFRTGDELREQTARVRAHLARLDLLADQYDAINEAARGIPQDPGAEHNDWCAPGACQSGNDEEGPWAVHNGIVNALPNRGRHAGRIEPLLHAALYDESAVEASTLCVTFFDEGTPYTGPEADLLIADFEQFLAGLKAQRAQLGAVDERFCGTHGWCVEHDHGHGSAEAPDCTHESATATLAVPAHQDAGREHVPGALLDVSLWAADRSNPTPRALLSIDDDAELPMDADQLEAFADQLAVFRAQVAAKAMQLRQDEATR